MINYLANRSIYILIAVIFILLSIFQMFVTKKRTNIFLLISALFIFSFFGICKGQNVGLDTAGYSANYINCRNITDVKGFLMANKPEFLFFGIMYIFSNLLGLPEIVFYLFEYSFISFFLFLSFFKKENSVLKLSIMFFIGFFIMSYSGIRQTMAMSIMVFATNILFYSTWNKKRKLITYYALMLFATLFLILL